MGPTAGQAVASLASVVVLAVVPASGIYSGGTSVAIKGLNFSSSAAPLFGETSPTGISATVNEITCTTALTDSAFLEDVTVENTPTDRCIAHSVFDRTGGATVPMLDPNDLPNSAYLIDYAGAGVWDDKTNGAKDVGPVYMDRSLTLDALPTAGTAVNGYTPAVFVAASQQALDTTPKLSPYIFGGDITDLKIQPTTGFTSISLVWIDAAAAPSADPWTDPGVWADSSGYPCLGLTVSSNGIAAVGYDTLRASVVEPCSTGAWHLVVVRCSTTQMQLRLDGTESLSPAAFNILDCSAIMSTGQPVAIGKNPYIAFSDIRLLFQQYVGRRLSDAEVDGVGTYLQAKFALAMGFVAASVDPLSFSRSCTWIASYGGGAWEGVKKTNNANGNELVVGPGANAPGASTLNGLPTATFNGINQDFQATRLTKDMLGTDEGGIPVFRDREFQLGWSMTFLAKFNTQPVTSGVGYVGACLFTDPQAVVGVSGSSDAGLQAYQIDDIYGVNNYVMTPSGGAPIADGAWALVQARWTTKNLELRAAEDGSSLTAWQQVKCAPATYPTGTGRPWFGVNYSQGVRLDGEMALALVSQRTYSTYTLDCVGAWIQDRYARAFGIAIGGAAYSMTAAAGALTVSGQSVGFGVKMPAGVGAFVWARNAANIRAQRKIVAATGAIVWARNAAGLLAQRRLVATLATFAWARNAANLLVGRKLAAVTGAYVLSGQAVLFRRTLRMVAVVSAYVLSGQAAGLRAQRKIATTAGAFALAGQAALFSLGRRLTAVVGAFSLSGGAATLSRTRVLQCTSTSYVLASSATGLRVQRKISAQAVAFVVAGPAVGFVSGRSMAAGTGVFVWARNAATLSRTRVLVVSSGAFALAGTDVGFGVKMPAGTGSFSLVRNPANFVVARHIAAVSGAYAIAGVPVGFGVKMPAGTGAFVVDGTDAGLLQGRKLAAQSAAFNVAGGAITTVVGRSLVAELGAFDVTGSELGLIAVRGMFAQSTAFAISGQAAYFTVGVTPFESKFRNAFVRPVILFKVRVT